MKGQQRADQSRAAGRGERVDVAQCRVALGKHTFDESADMEDVIP
jgi:hypothetical protein